MKTLARYMKEIGKNVKVENLPAAELDHLFHLWFSTKYPKIFERKRFFCQHSEGQRLQKSRERFCAARVIKSTDIAPEVDWNEITRSVYSPKKTICHIISYLLT